MRHISLRTTKAQSLLLGGPLRGQQTDTLEQSCSGVSVHRSCVPLLCSGKYISAALMYCHLKNLCGNLP